MQRMTVSAWVVALGMCVAPLHGQVINTVAGTTWFFPRQPMTALTAPLESPTGLAADLQGNVYISDVNNNVIMRLSQDGILSVVAGNGALGFSGDGGPAVGASLSLSGAQLQGMFVSGGVAVDVSGNVYIADTGNNRIRKITSTGTIVTVAGNGLPGFFGDGSSAVSASLNSPRGVAVDAAGNLYIADTLSFRVRKVTPAGIISTVAGNGQNLINSSVGPALGDGGPATQAPLFQPCGVAVDPAGNLFIAGDWPVRKVNAGGVVSSIQLSLGSITSAVAVGSSGDLFVLGGAGDLSNTY